MLRIGIDGKLLSSCTGGIGRYAVNLVTSLLTVSVARDHVFEFVLFTGPQTARELLGSLPGTYSEHFCTLQSSLLRSLLTLPVGLMREHIDVFHGLDHVGIPLFFKKGKYVVTVHDVLPLILPQMFTRKHRLVVMTALARVSRQADLVIVPSQSVKQDVVHYLHVGEDRIVVIPEGCETRFRPVGAAARLSEVRLKYDLPALYILFLSTLQPRKNITTLLKAFAHLRHIMALDPALRLVIAGARGWYDNEIFQTIQALGLEQVVRCPGFVAEEDLPDLYRGAIFFVFPSLYEGFGLPVLEAMRCGVPVIASNLSAIPEVVGKAAWLIDPHNVEELAAAMGELLHNEALRERLRHKGLARAQSFSWETTAQKTLDLYVSLAG